MARLSQHSLSKMGKKGERPFKPDLKEWIEVCRLVPYDQDIFRHFGVSKETFYKFLDRERYAKEQGQKSSYIDAYNSQRYQTKKSVLTNLLDKALSGDTACSIFAAKTYGGLIESKDIKHIELKKIEVAFKTKQFLTELANKFGLNYDQLDAFADKFFSNSKLEDI